MAPQQLSCLLVGLTLLFTKGIVQVQPHPLDQKIPPQDAVLVYQSRQSPTPNANIVAGPSIPTPGIPTMPQTRVYHYINPTNGNHITSLLPPEHPEMVCLQRGSHVEETKYGFLGEFCFPLHFLCPALMQVSSVRSRRGHCLVPVGDWVVSLGPDRYVQTMWCCDQGTAIHPNRWLEEEERELILHPHIPIDILPLRILDFILLFMSHYPSSYLPGHLPFTT